LTAVAEFPAASFRMDGDAGAVRASAGKWSSFGSAAAEASGQITSIDTGEFVGPEGDLFRHGLNKDMPRHLQITGDAFGKVAGALTSFAARLESLQEQMRPLAQRAPGLWAAVQAAQGRLDRAHSADQAHARQQAAQPPPSAGPPPPDSYVSDAPDASAAVTEAQRRWQDCLDAANGLRAQLSTAAQTAARAIVEAKGLRFKENPKWWDIGGQFTNFVRDHKGLLQKLSGALKVVSLVSGLLSFIPVLAPIMGPIALGTALAASAIDLSVYAATGEGNLTEILVDTGLNLLPFAGKLAKPLAGLARAGGNRLAWEAGRFGAGLNAAREVQAADSIVGITADGAAVLGRGPSLSLSERAAAFAEGRAGYVKTVTIDSSKYPECASHVEDAQAGNIWRGDQVTPNRAPKPDVLTIDRAGAKANRADSLRGIDTREGLHRDEYPPAMFREGGDGASVKYISPGDNTGAGSSVRHQLTGIPNNAKIKISVR
jgi:hypothetical protein